ncbi:MULTISPECIES: NAD(P)H-binding protein [unclassified Streptomyces]|uniref:NAD(P)H-binding protein n=1 Tax=unclassified Streptomyces TaxID=2593676 RepID=UPI0036F005E3
MIVVTGATGNVGRPLVAALTAAGEQVTAVSRRPAPDLPVRHVQADVGDAESLRPALEGADALFLLIGAELHQGGEPPSAVLDVAKAAGVRRVVLLSSQGAVTRPDAVSHAGLRAFEEAVRQSGLDWTLLRPGAFASNAFAWADSVRAHRTVAAPFADVALPVVDPADIAAAADVALREEGHAGRAYELTGPVALSPREQAVALGEAIGAEVRFTELSRAEARAFMTRFMPEPVVDGTLDILGSPLPAEQRVSPDLRTLLGREPGAFAQWAERNAAAFA